MCYYTKRLYHTLRANLDVKPFIPDKRRITNEENTGLKQKQLYPNYQHEHLPFIRMFYT